MLDDGKKKTNAGAVIVESCSAVHGGDRSKRRQLYDAAKARVKDNHLPEDQRKAAAERRATLRGSVLLASPTDLSANPNALLPPSAAGGGGGAAASVDRAGSSRRKTGVSLELPKTNG